MSPRLRPTSVPSGMLMHLAVWPQQTWAEDWRLCPFWRGGAGSPSNTMLPELRPTSIPSGILIHPAIWPQRTWAENCGMCPFWEGQLGPHLTQCGRALPICMPSFILIHPTVWLQYTNVTERKHRQDNGPTG